MRERKRHTGSWAAEHEYHGHLFLFEYGFFGFALSSRRCRRVILALVYARDVEGISDLLYEVGGHRDHGPDQASARARRAGGRSSGGARMRVRWLRGGGRGRSTRRRRRGRLRGRALDSVHVLGSEATRLTSTKLTEVWLAATARARPRSPQWTSDTTMAHSSTSCGPATTQTRPTSSPLVARTLSPSCSSCVPPPFCTHVSVLTLRRV